MGDLADRSNTFWQLFHMTTGSSRWSLVTPEGTADNGGLVASSSAASVLAGVLPNGLLRFSPLSLSHDGGASWSPAFLPGGLATAPDALAYQQTGALAVVGGGRVLEAPPSLASWRPLVSAARLGRVSRPCGVTSVDAVAITSTGMPLVATGCRRGGVVGVFTSLGGSWQAVGATLGQPLRRSGTGVLRLETSGSSSVALVMASEAGRRDLVALWRTAGAPWTQSPPLALPADASVQASAVGAGGRVAVLAGTAKSLPSAFETQPGGRWAQLPRPPAAATALALPGSSLTFDASPVDAFTVEGGTLGVYALTPSGARWAEVQTSQVPIAYGSSS